MILSNPSRALYAFGSFLAGFGLMTVELVSARIVAPQIGSSVYTWTSVIGVTLLGLAVGSWLGGKIADQTLVRNLDPLPSTFFLSAVFVFAIPALTRTTDFIIYSSGSIIWISLCVSLYLFLVPAMLIGAIQPLILKRYATDFSHIGSLYGRLSALWSVGSILGVFLTGFVFVSTIGSTTTLYWIALLLFLTGLVFICVTQHRKGTMVVAIGCVLAAVAIYLIPGPQAPKNVVLDTETDYYRVRIADVSLPGFGLSRVLFLDIDSHSVDPQITNSAFYPEMYPVFGHLKPDISRILAIGSGAYTMPKNFKTFYSESQVEVIDLDPELVSISEEYFDVNPDDFVTHVGDARILLPRLEREYDLIFGDAFSSFIGVPWHVLTDEWNKHVRSKLTPDGIYAVNMIGALRGQKAGFAQSVIATFSQTFPNYYVFAFGSSQESIQNIVVVGVNGDLPLSTEKLKETLASGPNSFLAHRLIELERLPAFEGTILTDDFAPVERLMSPLIRTYFPQHLAWVRNIF